MRTFSLLFAFISLVLLVQLVAYLIIGPVRTVFVVALLIGVVACLAASVYVLKPYESREALQRRRELWRRRRGLDGGQGKRHADSGETGTVDRDSEDSTDGGS